MLFATTCALWAFYESALVILVSLPSSLASDERKEAIELKPKTALFLFIFLIIADNALLFVSLVTVIISNFANEQTINHYLITALLVNLLSDIIISSDGIGRILSSTNKRNSVLFTIIRILKLIAIVLIITTTVMGLQNL